MPPRTYRSERRQQQAEETREAIVRAARDAFVDRGFRVATMADIAKRAGVAVQTIYFGFPGGKGELLRAINDALDAEAGIGPIVAELRGTTDPLHALSLSVRATRQMNERCGDVLRVLFASATEGPEHAQLWEDGMRRHDAGAEATVRILEASGALALPRAEARTVLGVWTAPQTWWQLVGHHRLSWDAAEALVLSQVRALVGGTSRGTRAKRPR